MGLKTINHIETCLYLKYTQITVVYIHTHRKVTLGRRYEI